MNLNSRKNTVLAFDRPLLLTVLALCIYGLLVISSATSSLSGGSLPYIRAQAIATVIGFISIAVMLNIDSRVLEDFYLPIYAACNLLLFLTLVIGTGEAEWGSRSWIRIGGWGFQPAEIVKIGIIVSIAKFISVNADRINRPLTLLKIIAFSSVPLLLILKQPDFGTAMVYVFFIFTMLFLAGLDLKYVLLSILGVLLSLPVIWLKLDSYQKDRILNFLNPELDSAVTGYQVAQSKIAIGSGSLFGSGLFNGNQTQYGFLPEKHTDFIFAVVGEELGFLGATVLIALLLFFIYTMIKRTQRADSLFQSLTLGGITAMFFIHIAENIAMTLGLAPVTGIPLPFISYGGTFQLTNLIAMAIALNMSIRSGSLKL